VAYHSSDVLSDLFQLDGIEIPVADFLAYCLYGDRNCVPSQFKPEDLAVLRTIFLQGGLAALEAVADGRRWVHFGLEVGPGPVQGICYERLRDLARKELHDGQICNFFFMHKPPGLRVRYELTGGNLHELRPYLHSRLSVLKAEGVISGIIPSLYEPETHLFGGAVSMRSVHELFTADSLAWLDYHTLASGDLEIAGPAWALSLAMLRLFFAALGITDWEDLDVWTRIRRNAGRELPIGTYDQSNFTEIIREIQSFWMDPHLFTQLPPSTRAIAERYQTEIIGPISKWREDYFGTENAQIGPRAAAALFTIFHWNRAGLPPPRQAILTEALAARETV